MSVYKEEIFGEEDQCPYCGHYDNDINEYSDDDDIVKINGVTYCRNYMMCRDCGEYYIWFEPIEDNKKSLKANTIFNYTPKQEIRVMASKILDRIVEMNLDTEEELKLIQWVSNYFSEVYGKQLYIYQHAEDEDYDLDEWGESRSERASRINY